MWLSHRVGAVILWTLVTMTTGQVPMMNTGQCRLRFQTSATACVTNASLNIQNVQYIASNGTSGAPPAEGVQIYRQRLCAVKPQLEVCGQQVTQQLLNSTLCLDLTERQAVQSSFQITFGGLDSNCAQPCRYSVMDELSQCFRFVNLQPMGSVSDLSLIRQSFLRPTDNLHDFCMNRQSLLSCLQQKVVQCPDAARVLAQHDLSINSYERGVDMICQNKGLYLAGIHCFRDPIGEVRMCYQNLDRRLQTLMQTSPLPTADHVSLAEFCSIRLEQIECEMGAWARHQYRTCARAVTGFKNDLACSLLPAGCRSVVPQLVSNLCNPLNYFAEERSHYNGAPRASLAGGTLAWFLLVFLAGWATLLRPWRSLV